MDNSHRRFSILERLDILYEADRLGTTHVQSKYGLPPNIISSWEKDLKKSKTRQAAIKKQEDAQVIETLKAEIEQLKMVIANQAALLQKGEQKPEVNEPTIMKKKMNFIDLLHH